MKILVTGVAGFIGFHVAARLLSLGCHKVFGVDNLNAYYDPQLKRDRLAQITADPNFAFERIDIADRQLMQGYFERHGFDIVVHLAAQAGVRYSLVDPHAYVDSNLVGFVNILEGCRHTNVSNLIYASSSSVYGLNENLPFRVTDSVDHPASLYGATKRANELMAHSYSHLFRMPTTGLRFFTVYGPWGRPDMALFLFAEKILSGQPLTLFNGGDMERSFTYVDDVVDSIVNLMSQQAAEPQLRPSAPCTSSAPFFIYNVGNETSVNLRDVISYMEKELGLRAIIEDAPMHPGDVKATIADITSLHARTGTAPRVSLEEGLSKFLQWYKSYTKNREAAETSPQPSFI